MALPESELARPRRTSSHGRRATRASLIGPCDCDRDGGLSDSDQSHPSPNHYFPVHGRQWHLHCDRDRDLRVTADSRAAVRLASESNRAASHGQGATIEPFPRAGRGRAIRDMIRGSAAVVLSLARARAGPRFKFIVSACEPEAAFMMDSDNGTL